MNFDKIGYNQSSFGGIEAWDKRTDGLFFSLSTTDPDYSRHRSYGYVLSVLFDCAAGQVSLEYPKRLRYLQEVIQAEKWLTNFVRAGLDSVRTERKD
jgi:hypothetical protein